jgi:hypothetical protein
LISDLKLFEFTFTSNGTSGLLGGAYHAIFPLLALYQS